MTSSRLIRLQRALPPTGVEISKNENMTLKIVFNKLSKNLGVDFRFEILVTSGPTFQVITSGHFKIGQPFFKS